MIHEVVPLSSSKIFIEGHREIRRSYEEDYLRFVSVLL